MPDDFDRASDQEEMQRVQALNLRKQEAPASTGFCLYCEEDVPPSRRWCDTDCRDAWEKYRGR